MVHSLEQRVLTILACGHGEPQVGQALPSNSHSMTPKMLDTVCSELLLEPISVFPTLFLLLVGFPQGPAPALPAVTVAGMDEWPGCGAVLTSLGSTSWGEAQWAGGCRNSCAWCSLPALSISSSHRECVCGNSFACATACSFSKSMLAFPGRSPSQFAEGQRSLWGITTLVCIFPFSLPTRMAAWAFSNPGSKPAAPARCFLPRSRFKFHRPLL